MQYTYLSSLSSALMYVDPIPHLTIILTVFLQVFAVKARLSYPFGKRIVGNKWNFVGILSGACLGMFIIYTPPLHVVFGGSVHLSPLYWLIPVAFGCLLLAWASLRVVLLRKSVEHMRVGEIKGLMMCKCHCLDSMLGLANFLWTVPTMRTMSMRSRGTK